MSQEEKGKNSKKTQAKALEKQTSLNNKNPNKDEEIEDLEEFETETWNSGGMNPSSSQDWFMDWDNKQVMDDFYYQLKEFLLKK